MAMAVAWLTPQCCIGAGSAILIFYTRFSTGKDGSHCTEWVGGEDKGNSAFPSNQYFAGWSLIGIIMKFYLIYGLGRLAGLITLEAEDSNAPLDALKRVGKSIAMHIVATKPLFLSKELVSASAVENERGILRTKSVLNDLSKEVGEGVQRPDEYTGSEATARAA
uniref:Translation elongation factor EFTs/EF1B dimerisation domain-containing protein n=1 Tax=Oryza barthii TaxID=65489 RepID=A0A0D3HVD8_9ORYZ